MLSSWLRLVHLETKLLHLVLVQLPAVESVPGQDRVSSGGTSVIDKVLELVTKRILQGNLWMLIDMRISLLVARGDMG